MVHIRNNRNWQSLLNRPGRREGGRKEIMGPSAPATEPKTSSRAGREGSKPKQQSFCYISRGKKRGEMCNFGMIVY